LPPTVAIIGAGPLGRWLAFTAARAGFPVFLEDVMPGNLHHAQEVLRQQLNPAALGLDPGSRAAPAIAFVSTIEDAVRKADLAIDCVPDELESKLEILWLLDRMAPPHTVLATPTTRLSITDLAGCTYRPEKCIAIAAEASALAANLASEILLRTTPQTSPETVTLVRNFWAQLGFTPLFELDSIPR
jgi:3-hydroxybutyryl-CoA dehydrogenase